MQSSITGRHTEITPALKAYVESKLARLDRHHEPPTSAQVILTVEKKLNQKAEAILHVAGETVYAESVDTDMYAAIDALTDKLDRQLVRHKERRTDHHATPVARMPGEL